MTLEFLFVDLFSRAFLSYVLSVVNNIKRNEKESASSSQGCGACGLHCNRY